MLRRRFVSVAASAALACLVVSASARAADPAEDPCEGRNPAYCKKDAAGKGGAPKAAASDAADDCEGKNPLYCKEAPVPAKPAADDDHGKTRADSDSRNPARNPNPNPKQDPNRKPAHDSAGE